MNAGPTILSVAMLCATLGVAAEAPDVAIRDASRGAGSSRVLAVNGAPGAGSSPERVASLRDLAWAAPRLTAAELHSAGPLAAAERERLRPTLQAGELVRVGLTRAFSVPAGFDLSLSKLLPVPGRNLGGGLLESNAGRFVWSAGFESPGAGGVRLRLDDLSFPPGTVAYVYSRSGEVHGPYDVGTPRAEPFWTNTVFASSVYLEIRFPANADLSASRLTVAAIGHLEAGAFAPSSATASEEALPDCFRDVRCTGAGELPGLDQASRAVALLLFDRDGSSYVCSGALVNTTAGTSIPYVLTANHCINSAASAKSAELFWDYKTATCAGPVPNRSGFPRSLGATLLATGALDAGEPDYTLLKLAQAPPPGRFHLGWSAEKLAGGAGATIFRVAHPDGGPQMFSMHAVSSEPTPGECATLPSDRFVYSKNLVGATKGGSSGAPAFLADGFRIVGQLYGRCGNNLPNLCDAVENSAVDGAFASYFPKVARWLDPPAMEPCTPAVDSICLLDARFRVSLSARDSRTGSRVAGLALPENDLFGYFSIPALTGQPGNPEVFVKMLDGRNLSGSFWVFYGGLTDLEFTLTVTDTETGLKKSYTKPAGSYCGDADTQAF